MTPTQFLLYSAVVNGIVLGLAIWAIQRMLLSFTDKVKESVHELKCEDDKIWDALNTHGHKGLDRNGARVTR